VHLRRVTGILLILTPIAFNIFFTLLSVTFEYPDILRKPTGYVLRHFDAGAEDSSRSGTGSCSPPCCLYR
jgi:hypothetical protein